MKPAAGAIVLVWAGCGLWVQASVALRIFLSRLASSSLVLPSDKKHPVAVPRSSTSHPSHPHIHIPAALHTYICCSGAMIDY
eukprot:scaffold10189_cov119-Isochrysis_galbana.AAC.2